MRLFTGVALPEEVASNVGSLVARLKALAPIRWSLTANLHITTKFIGAWPAQRLEELKRELGGVPRRNKIPIQIKGIGWYPVTGQPRILLTHVQAPETLKLLALETDERLAGLGVSKEKKSYQPHLTLARVKAGADLSALRRALEGLESLDLGTFEAGAFHLYLSEPAPGGSSYQKLATYPFQG